MAMKPRAVIEAWIARFNAADVDGLVKLYAIDAVNHQVALEPVMGRAATRVRRSRTLRIPAFIAPVILLAISVASAAEAMWPKDSAMDFSIFVTLQRYQIYADDCSARTPDLKPQFESLMADLNNRIQRVSKGLLASDAFKGTKDKAVPAAIVFAFRDTLHDAEHNFERQDAAFICPKTMKILGDLDDESLKSGLSETLTAVQNMTRNLEKETVR